jgi:signal peptidase I
MTPTPKPQIPTPKSTDETLKETFESIVIAFILAFIFRAYVVEAFIIPTGSMAPTLLGQHFEVRCEQCGYGFTVDHAREPRAASRALTADCPMCRFPQDIPFATPTRSGDRLLVQKYLYNLIEPRRWDVVVFRNPQAFNDTDGSAGPKINYIKRLVGLPNEALLLIDGNVFVRPLDQPDAPWRIARKTDPQANADWEAIQRSVWQPVYHSAYVPIDQGRASRASRGDTAVRRQAWRIPWRPTNDADPRWDLGGPQRGWQRTYRFTPDPGQPDRPGELRFDWSDYYTHGTPYAYNRLVHRATRGVFRGQPIEELRLAVVATPRGPGVSTELEITARLEETRERLGVRLQADGGVELYRGPLASDDGPAVNRAIGHVSLPPSPVDQPRRVELWWVDQEALVWIDGEVVLRRTFDLPMQLVRSRPAPSDTPHVAIRVHGGAAALSGVELDRDLAYTPRLGDGTPATRGALSRNARGQLTDAPPIAIRPARFFVLGDNSPISSDGRFWNDVEPWIERRMFSEQERLGLDTPTDGGGLANYSHVVPRGLLVGRAFFIYFPAPYAVNRTGRQVLPNFGAMRLVH